MSSIYAMNTMLEKQLYLKLTQMKYFSYKQIHTHTHRHKQSIISYKENSRFTALW